MFTLKKVTFQLFRTSRRNMYCKNSHRERDRTLGQFLLVCVDDKTSRHTRWSKVNSNHFSLSLQITQSTDYVDSRQSFPMVDKTTYHYNTISYRYVRLIIKLLKSILNQIQRHNSLTHTCKETNAPAKLPREKLNRNFSIQ